jgi:DGQHR domain-containing protein
MDPNSYKCIKVYQRPDGTGGAFVLFAAKAKEILSWAAIERLDANSQKGPQRIEKPYKVKAIRAFFEADPVNTIPTAVVIGFRQGTTKIEPVQGCESLFEFSFQNHLGSDKPGTIVDGQHRVLGVNSYNPEAVLNVVGLLEVDDSETAFQFLVINNKAARVSSDHLRGLALQYDRQNLTQRLQKVRLNLDPNLRFVGFANSLEDSPFKGMLTLPTNNPNAQVVPPAAIEESINYIRSQKLPELVEDDDILIGLFFSIWKRVKKKWPELWRVDSKLLGKVSVVCLTQFIVDNLLRQYDWSGLDIFEPEVVEVEVDNMLSFLSPEFWSPSTEWIAKGLDTQAGRKILLDSVEQMVRNSRQRVPWSTDIAMVRAS